MSRTPRLSSRVCWAVCVMLCTLPSAAAASPFARYVQEASQDPRASTAPTAVIAAEPISVPVTPVEKTAVERTLVVAKVD